MRPDPEGYQGPVSARPGRRGLRLEIRDGAPLLLLGAAVVGLGLYALLINARVGTNHFPIWLYLMALGGVALVGGVGTSLFGEPLEGLARAGDRVGEDLIAVPVVEWEALKVLATRRLAEETGASATVPPHVAMVPSVSADDPRPEPPEAPISPRTAPASLPYAPPPVAVTSPPPPTVAPRGRSRRADPVGPAPPTDAGPEWMNPKMPARAAPTELPPRAPRTAVPQPTPGAAPPAPGTVAPPRGPLRAPNLRANGAARPAPQVRRDPAPPSPGSPGRRRPSAAAPTPPAAPPSTDQVGDLIDLLESALPVSRPPPPARASEAEDAGAVNCRHCSVKIPSNKPWLRCESCDGGLCLEGLVEAAEAGQAGFCPSCRTLFGELTSE